MGNTYTPASCSIAEYMTGEHVLLSELLARAETGNPDIYRRFRQLLLRHIRIEERLLLPMAARRRGGEPLPLHARLRLDHGALAALMTLPPMTTTLRTVRTILLVHNALEEGPAGVYQQCTDLAGSEAAGLFLQFSTTSDVPVSPWNCDDRALKAVRRVLIRSGYGDLPVGE
jgi:hypothetical protein